MPQEILDNGVAFGVQRNAINNNFTELYSIKMEATQVLSLTNTNVYTPTELYHPVTKTYVDSIPTNWEAQYNPQNIYADVFNRENHTGNITVNVITTNTNNRFVSDAQMAAWDSKEDAIGDKNDAFNSTYGTTTGTTARGDHTHTKESLGLGNVDNTSDQNKPVSDPQNVALALKANKDDAEYLNFEPQASLVTPDEGSIYYSSEKKDLMLVTDIENVEVPLAQRSVMRVYNNTGATILTGRSCRAVGTVNNTPSIELSLANAYANAHVDGVAASDIPNDSYGYLIIFGVSTGYDLSAFNVGDVIYLSDTEAGRGTTTPPDFATEIAVILNNSVSGVALINIDNDKALPPAIAWMHGLAGKSYNLPDTGLKTVLTNFDTADGVILAVDPVTGTINLINTGVYRYNAMFTVTFTADGKDNRNFHFDIYDVTSGDDLVTFSWPVPVDVNVITGAVNFPFRINNIGDIGFRIWNDGDDDLTGVEFTAISIDVETVNVLS